ncbi:class I SAM-dependent methyltransferase [Oscillibacter sp.]|uniref:class I SAM-dependent methyltransferase n=1 Tax=Oscillibacter sp. TaxID=1945593 RepID=UPI002D806929|nr:class I SAM-dependent methyltransferase [Oscillibacter sp.]
MSSFWDRWAPFYDLAQRTNRRANAAAAVRAAELIPAGARVLDCAAGTGQFSLAAAERAASVLCTDLSEAMLKQAEKKARRKGLSNLRFARRDVTALPDPDGSFNAVIAANVLHLLPEPETAVRELWRVTAPGGRLILPTYLQGKAGTAYGTMIRIYQGVGFHYEHAFTPETYRTLLERMNLGRVTVEVISGRLPVGLAVLRKPG